MANPHGRTIGESTYYEMYLRRPDIGRFFNQDKKLPTSGRGRSVRVGKEMCKCEGESTYYKMYRLAIARIKNQYQFGINTKRKIMRCLGECAF